MNFKVRDKRKGWFYLDKDFIDIFGDFLGPVGISIYVLLCYYADNKTQTCYPSQDKIAKKLGITRPTVVKYISALEKHLLISTEKISRGEEGRWANNIYYLLDKVEWEAPCKPPLHGPCKPDNMDRVNLLYTNKTISNKTYNEDFLKKKSSMSDVHYDDTTDPETGEPIRTKLGNKRIDGEKDLKYEIKNSETVKRIAKHFKFLCKNDFNTIPLSNGSWYKQINRALSTGGLTEKQIYKLFDEWFTQGLPEKHMISLNRALSDNQISSFKVENSL